MFDAIVVNFLSASLLLPIFCMWYDRHENLSFFTTVVEIIFSVFLIWSVCFLQSLPVYFQKEVYFKPDTRMDFNNKVILIRNGNVVESSDREVMASSNLLIKTKYGCGLFGDKGYTAQKIYVVPEPVKVN